MLYFSILASGSPWQEYVIISGGLSLQIKPSVVTTWRSLLPDETGAVNDGLECEAIRVGETAPPSECRHISREAMSRQWRLVCVWFVPPPRFNKMRPRHHVIANDGTAPVQTSLSRRHGRES
jgi:hypothetical protein